MIETHNLTRRFGRETALDGVTFRAAPGERIAVVGRNGAGKTTLLRVLSTFLPPNGGTATISGFGLFEQSNAVRTIVGYLPENAPLDPDLTVADYLRFRGRLRRMPRARLRRRLHDVVAFCGVAPLVAAPIRTLSPGQRHAVGLADALLHEPDVLLVDEPLAASDPIQAQKFTELFAAPEVSEGRVLLFATHSADLVRAAATRILSPERARLLADVAEVPRDATLPELFALWSDAAEKEAAP